MAAHPAFKVHVTGALGFIGKAVVQALAASGHAVTSSDLKAGEGVRALDLRDRAAVCALMREAAPDVVVHAGAISGAMLAADDPALMFDVNVTGTLNVAEAMRQTGCRRLIFVSSNAVYADTPTRDPLDESGLLGAGDAYGASKIAGEAVLRAYAASSLHVIALRVSSVFGLGRTTPYLISEALDAVAAGQPVVVTDDRSNMRQFVHVSDVVRAVERAVLLERPGFTPINISGGTYLSEESIVRRLLGRGADAANLQVVADKGRNDDGRVGPLSIARAAELLGYVPEVEIGAALRELGTPIVSGSSPTS
jgi:nucleoside-diphosphate-sugar epimerase